jgi:alpha-N-arabinofuranosidase
VNGNGTVSLEMNVPTLPLQPFEEAPVRTTFNEEKLQFDWQYLRNPIRENYSLTEKKGSLRITTSPYTLDDADAVSMVCRRQTEHDFSAATELEFNSLNENEEAGMTLIQNNTHHYDLLFRKSADKRLVQLRIRVGSLSYIAAEKEVEGNRVLLNIEGSPDQYTFYFADSRKKEYIKLGKQDTRYLSTEVAGGFTGVMIGLYASSNGKESSAKAFFDWFDYRHQE